jgi:hypothetical protein
MAMTLETLDSLSRGVGAGDVLMLAVDERAEGEGTAKVLGRPSFDKLSTGCGPY